MNDSGFTASPVATAIPFDNSTNGFVATNTQAAIEEVKTALQANTASEASATSTTTTTSLTDVLIGSMTITPVTGTYLVFFSASLGCSIKDFDVFASLYFNGAKIAHTERKSTQHAADQAVPFATHGIIIANGINAIEARWRTTGGTVTAYQRTLNILRVS